MIKDKCAPDNYRKRHRSLARTEECIKNTLDKTLAKIGRPEIIALHKAKRG